MKTFRLLTALTLGTLLWGCAESGKKAEGPFYTDIESRAQLHDWFRYAPERPIVVSGHRGGMVTGYPERLSHPLWLVPWLLRWLHGGAC